jgi:hypothetical protein
MRFILEIFRFAVHFGIPLFKLRRAASKAKREKKKSGK